MKKVLSILLMLICINLSSSAYDFMVEGLCYKINSDGTSVTVTFQNVFAPMYTNLSGELNIPSNVTYEGIT